MPLTQEQLIHDDKLPTIMNHDPIVVPHSPVSPCSQPVDLAPPFTMSMPNTSLEDQHHTSLSRNSEKDVSISAPGINKAQLIHLLTALYTNDVAAFTALEPEEEFVLDCWQLLDIVRPFSHSLLSSQPPPTTSPLFKVPSACIKRPSVEPTVSNQSAVFSDDNSVSFPVWTSPTPSKVLSSSSRVDGATYSGDLFAASTDSIITTDLPVSEDKAQAEGTVDAVINSSPGPIPPQPCSPVPAQAILHHCPPSPELALPETNNYSCVSIAPASPGDHHLFPSICDDVPSPLPTADPPPFTPSPPGRVPSPGFQVARTVIPPTLQEFERMPSPETAFCASDPPAFESPPPEDERIPSPPSPSPLDMSCFFDASMPAPLAKRLRMSEEANSQSTTSPERHSAPSSPIKHPNKSSQSEHHVDGDSEEGDMSSSQPVLSSHTPLRRPDRSRPSTSIISFSPITPKPAYEQMPTPNLRKALSEYGLRNLPKKKAIRILNHIYEELHPYVEVPSVVMEEVSQAPPTRTTSITPPLAPSPDVDSKSAESESANHFASSTPTQPSLAPLGKARKCAEKTPIAEIQQRVYDYLRMNSDIYYNIVTYKGVTFTTKNNRKPSKPKSSGPTSRY